MEEAQHRLDRMQGLETTTRERARAVTDQIDAELERARTVTSDGIERARQNEAQANELLAQLGAKGTSSQYLSTAGDEKTIADKWRYATLALAIATSVLSVALLHDVSGRTVGSVIARASVLLPPVLITLYAGRQSAEHRTQERHARTLGLQLASLSLFLADLSGDGKQAIKQGVADRLFAPSDKQVSSRGYPSSQDELIKLLSTAISKLR
jgi:hypothetical protein